MTANRSLPALLRALWTIITLGTRRRVRRWLWSGVKAELNVVDLPADSLEEAILALGRLHRHGVCTEATFVVLEHLVAEQTCRNSAYAALEAAIHLGKVERGSLAADAWFVARLDEERKFMDLPTTPVRR